MLIHDKIDLITSLEEPLEDLVNAGEGLTHLFLASREGLPMISTKGGTKLPEEMLAVINATSIYHGQMILNELHCGNIKEMYIKGDNGYMVFFPVGNNASLLGLCSTNTNLRQILLKMRRISKKLLQFLD